MQYSVVNYSELIKTWRFDAEYFKKEFLEVASLLDLKRNNFKTLEELKLKIDASAFYPSLEPLYNMGDLPFLRVVDVNTKIDYDNCLRIPDNIFEEFKTLKIVEKGDLVITKGGSIGRVGLVEKRSAVSRDLIFLNSSKLDDIDYIFLFIYSITNFYNNLLRRSSSLTAQPHLTIKLVKDIPFFYPERNFRKKISNLYLKSRDLIRASKNFYAEAENLLLSELGLKDWRPGHKLSFVRDFSTIDKAERMDAEYFQPKYDEIIKILEKFKVKPIGKLFDMFSSTSFNYSMERDDIAVIKTKNVTKDKINLDNIDNYISNKEFLSFKSGQKVKYRDVLFASMGVGSLGKTNIFLYKDKNCTIDSTLKIIREKRSAEVSAEVLNVLLNTLFMQAFLYRDVVGSTGIINIYDSRILNLPVPILSKEKQQEIAKRVIASHKAREESKILLEKARLVVDVAIEKNEKEATKLI